MLMELTLTSILFIYFFWPFKYENQAKFRGLDDDLLYLYLYIFKNRSVIFNVVLMWLSSVVPFHLPHHWSYNHFFLIYFYNIKYLNRLILHNHLEWFNFTYYFVFTYSTLIYIFITKQ